MPTFFDLQKFAATGIASHDMSAYDKARALAAFGGGAVQTLTDVPPLSFKANGKPLISWSMLGNGQQTGTPTPDAPIMPTFCGVRTRNLFDYTTMAVSIENSYLMSDGTIGTSNDWNISDYIPCNGTSFTLGYVGGNTPSFCLYDENKNYITGKSYNTGGASSKFPVSITSTITAKYIRFTYCKANPPSGDILSKIMLNSGSSLLPYQPFGWTIPITCGSQTTPIYLGQMQTVRRVRKLVLTGEETNWTYSAEYTRFTTVLPNALNTGTRTDYTPCSHYSSIHDSRPIPEVPDKSVYTGQSADIVYLQVKDTTYTTVESFKTYLQQQYANGTPVTVWYVLEEPTTGIVNEPLAKIGDYADDLHSTDAGVSIPTAKGQNTLTVDTELQPSSMTITYKK